MDEIECKLVNAMLFLAIFSDAIMYRAKLYGCATFWAALHVCYVGFADLAT